MTMKPAQKKEKKCPKCNSGHIDGVEEEGIYICLSCGTEWPMQ